MRWSGERSPPLGPWRPPDDIARAPGDGRIVVVRSRPARPWSLPRGWGGSALHAGSGRHTNGEAIRRHRPCHSQWRWHPLPQSLGSLAHWPRLAPPGVRDVPRLHLRDTGSQFSDRGRGSGRPDLARHARGLRLRVSGLWILRRGPGRTSGCDLASRGGHVESDPGRRYSVHSPARGVHDRVSGSAGDRDADKRALPACRDGRSHRHRRVDPAQRPPARAVRRALPVLPAGPQPARPLSLGPDGADLAVRGLADHAAQLAGVRRVRAGQYQRRHHALAGRRRRGRPRVRGPGLGQAGDGRRGRALWTAGLSVLVGGAGRHRSRPRSLPAGHRSDQGETPLVCARDAPPHGHDAGLHGRSEGTPAFGSHRESRKG